MSGPEAAAPGDAAAIRCGIVALIGRANVGKSTLLNALLEEKVSIVSPVVQTTRNLIRGVLTEPRGQLVFLDTPGVHKATGELGRIMNRLARSSIEGADIALLLLDRSRPPAEEDDGWMRRLMHAPLTVMAVLNKTDSPADHGPEYRKLWETVALEKQVAREIPWLDLSALRGDGLAALTQALFDHMPFSPPLFPDDVLTDFPRKLAIADVIREQLFLLLHDELPHAIGVVVEDINEGAETEAPSAAPSAWTVEANIYVNRHSQKMIVLGAKGRLLRSVKRKAEAILGGIYERPVHLNLWVKVEPHWDHNFWLLKKMGHAPDGA